MKRIYLYLAAIGFLFTFSACGNDWLDEMTPPTEGESDKSLITPNDAEYALNGIYSIFRTYEYYGARYTFYGDAKGEDMQARGDTKRVAKYYLFDMNAINAPTTYWSIPYKAIRNLNTIIQFTDKFSGDALTTQLKNIRGQALTGRAMAHFDLVKVHGMPYTKDNGASLGVPVVTTRLANDAKPARNTVAQVYEQIIKDLVEASDLISKSPNDFKLNWFATRLLLARAYLYKGDDKNAYEVAADLIAEAKKGSTYRLFTNAEYVSAWTKQTGAEYFYVILTAESEIEESKEFISYLMHRSGYDDLSLSSDFMAIMDTDMSDVRHGIIDKYKPATFQWYLKKYLAPSYQYSNIPVLRMSEAYLIAAEAAIKRSDKENAALYLNEIVKRANPAKSITKDDADLNLDRVLLERRKELVGEGHRLFDAMRNNKKIIRAGASHNSAVLKPETMEFDWNYNMILMPIPNAEMKVNPNIIQNKGYEDKP